MKIILEIPSEWTVSKRMHNQKLATARDNSKLPPEFYLHMVMSCEEYA